MTICSEAAGHAIPPGLRGCVLVTLGAAAGGSVDGPPGASQAAGRLAALLGARLLELGIDAGPDRELTTLTGAAEAGTAPWLAALPLDVGAPLADGSCWAQALGAWRQATLLVIPEPQLASGLPAAGCALLQRWQVPLLGLLQWGGEWQAAQRLRDGLPWLGLLPDAHAADERGARDADGAELALAAALSLRLRNLQQA